MLFDDDAMMIEERRSVGSVSPIGVQSPFR
jgi:hypothetical protein